MAEYDVFREPTPVHLNITFDKRQEALNLYEELRTWKPAGGWSAPAEEFFEALQKAADPGAAEG